MFQEGLFSFLTAQPTLTAILGTPETRGDENAGVFPMLAIGEPTMPYIVFQRVSGDEADSYQGANKLQYARVRFTCYASSYDAPNGCVKLAEALKKVFATYTGTWTDGTVVQNVTKQMEADDSEPIPHGTIYATHLDFAFSYLDNS